MRSHDATETAAKTGVPAGGLRERNKAQKMRKIRQAARELFIEKGYDDTTTREIARRAGVGLGTLFTYAADKRDLLFLIFNDELEEVAATAFEEVPPNSAFVDQLVHIFREFYVFFARQPHLARFMLREQTFYTAGPEAQRFQGHRERILLRLAKPIDAAKSRRQIASREDSITIARAIFSIYAAEIRSWLSQEESEIDLGSGLASLRRMLQLLINGLKPPDRREEKP